MKMKHSVTAETLQASYEKHKGNALMTLIGFYKGYYLNFFLSTLFYVVKHSPVWLLPICTANIINYVVSGTDHVQQKILFQAGILAVLLLLNIPMNFLHVHFRSVAVRNVEAGLRSSLVHKIQTMSILSEKDIQSGRLQSKIIRDVEGVETLSSQIFVSLLNILINVVVALSVTVTRSFVVFLFFLFMVPLAGALVYGFKRPIRAHNQRFRKQVETTSARVAEMVELVPVTRAHALEDEEISKMDKQVHQIAEEGYQLDIIQTNFGAVSWACFQIFQVVCLVFTAFLAAGGTIPTGDVVLYQSYFTTIVSQITGLLNLLPTIAKGLESVNSIGEVLMVEDVEETDGKEVLQDLRGEYHFDHVGYHYPGGEKDVITDLDLQVHCGETIAFVGESGAGKTTILNMLIGFILPTRGKLTVDGIDMGDLNLRSYRKHLAVVPQSTVLFSGSIRDNILYGTTGISEEVLDRVVEEAGLKSVLEKLPEGIDTPVGEHGDRLSGGQKQRISIARALIRDPRVIILDEATSALDAISEREVTSALDHISRSRTTFIVAHKLATIKRADRIVVMQEGTIAEIGTFEELMAQKGQFYHMEKEADQ